MKEVKHYFVDGQFELGPCNIVDRWDGTFKYWATAFLPCGCLMYDGDVAIAQANNWPAVIIEDFAFKLFCSTCNEEIAYSPSAVKTQQVSGWIDLLSVI